jgi:ABC-type lipoprotein release transport system permease subunit
LKDCLDQPKASADRVRDASRDAAEASGGKYIGPAHWFCAEGWCPAVVGNTIAETHGWRIGDRIPLRSSIFQRREGGDLWELTVEAIYDSTSRAFDTASVFMHYAYLDEGRQWGEGTTGWYVIRLSDPDRAPEIAAAVDG